MALLMSVSGGNILGAWDLPEQRWNYERFSLILNSVPLGFFVQFLFLGFDVWKIYS